MDYGPALKEKSAHYPVRWNGRTPKTIRMLQTVWPDVPRTRDATVGPAEQGTEYRAWTNVHGAVCAVFPDAEHLGVKPREFEVVEWFEADGVTVAREGEKPKAETWTGGPMTIARALEITGACVRVATSLLIDGEIPDTVFGLRVVIPGAIQNSANPGLAFSSARVWNTDTVYLLHVNPAISADGETLTALSQVRYSEWDVPYAAYRWEETHKSQRVTWVSVDVHQTEETVCADAIYLLTDVLG